MTQHLFSEFKPVTAAEWKAQLAKDLKGTDIESLVWKNENGFDIQPFYTSEDLHLSYQPAFTHTDWDICVAGKSKDAKILNQQLLQNLNGGATGISVECNDLDLATALQNVQLNYIHSTFYISEKKIHALKSLLEKSYDLNELHCTLFPEKALSTLQELTDWLQAVRVFKDYKYMKALTLDALPLHNQNGFASYEVAVILSGLNEYLNAVSKNDQPTSSFVIKTGVNSDYFIQIAKLRAIRRVWKLLAANYEISTPLHIIVETSSTNKSLSDKYTNLLRTTVEAMAAVSGGCNELIVTEFDLLFPSDPIRSQRMAINQQLILKEESYFDKVADVACGSYYIESITDAIATDALETMKQFEREGGYFKCLEKNSFEEAIKEQAQQHETALNAGEQISIGVTKFRNEKEVIGLNKNDVERLKHLSVTNPVLKFELDHFFKHHA